MAKGEYRGFSSYAYQRSKSFKVTDAELVKFDLLNHIFTRRGERVHMPMFGTRIPDLAFEPLDGLTISILEEDLRDVINFDPRVELLEMRTTPNYDDHVVVVAIRLAYIELGLVDNFDLNITFEGS